MVTLQQKKQDLLYLLKNTHEKDKEKSIIAQIKEIDFLILKQSVEILDFVPRGSSFDSVENLFNTFQEIIYRSCREKKMFFVECEHISDQKSIFDDFNILPDHPSRDKQQTFFINDDVLRPHTTLFNKYIASQGRFFTLGPVYRRDNDKTHLPCFTQVDLSFSIKNINEFHEFMVDFLDLVIQKFVNVLRSDFITNVNSQNMVIRRRTHYFPYTAPSFEYDLKCNLCEFGCDYCTLGWIEILGCGILKPNIHTSMGAAGLGLERTLVTLYNNICDSKISMRDLYLKKS